MRINLGNNFVVDVDNLNWTLKKIKEVPENTKKDGTVIETHTIEIVLGYMKDFNQTVEYLLKYHQSDLGHELELSLKEYAELVDKANKTAVQGFKRVREEE